MSLPVCLSALGWALLHSLWQLALVGLGAKVALALAGDARPRSQYLLAWVALALCLALPVATFLREAAGAPVTVAILAPGPALRGAAGAAAPFPAPALPAVLRIKAVMVKALPYVSLAWGLGACGLALRLLGAWAVTRRWLGRAQPAPAAWNARFQALARSMGVRARVLLKVGTRLASPVAVGLWRPVVLVPAAALAALPEAYLEALLAHELAHVLRRDYVFNLLQSLVEVLLFHHPVVWWLSRRIRTVREHLCDDAAARALGEPRRLALALNALDDLSATLAGPPLLAPAARGGTLLPRIQRLLLPPTPRPRPAWLPLALLALLLPCAPLALRAADRAAIPGQAGLLQELDGLAAKEGLDPDLLRAIAWAESGLLRSARSPLGAMGVLQVLPATARAYGAADLQDPAQVMAAGARYLRAMQDRYPGDLAKAVAAYNGGAEAVDAGACSAETRAYVDLVLSLYRARAVQVAQPLPDAAVDGVVRRLGDGRLLVQTRIGHRGPFRLTLLEDGPGGAILGTVQAGAREPVTDRPVVAPQVTVSEPRVLLAPVQGKALLVRLEEAGTGRRGETRVVLDGPWQTFAFSLAQGR